MKKRLYISYLLSAIVSFMLLAQSLHSYNHLKELFEEQHCHHNDTLSKHQLTHSHHEFEHCSVCLFSFGNSYFTTTLFAKNNNIVVSKTILSFYSQQTTSFFNGSFFSLRAPPCLLFA